MVEFIFFCSKCKNDFTVNTTAKTKTIICPHCQKTYQLEQLIKTANAISKELNKLAKKFAHIYFYTRVEFEQDYKLLNNTQHYFEMASLMMKEPASQDLTYPPRFEIVAFQFKTKDHFRIMLHSETLKPWLYNLYASPNFHTTFKQTIYNPHLYILPEDAEDPNLTLDTFASLAFHSVRYITLYEKFVLDNRAFFYPDYTFHYS